MQQRLSCAPADGLGGEEELVLKDGKQISFITVMDMRGDVYITAQSWRTFFECDTDCAGT